MKNHVIVAVLVLLFAYGVKGIVGVVAAIQPAHEVAFNITQNVTTMGGAIAAFVIIFVGIVKQRHIDPTHQSPQQ